MGKYFVLCVLFLISSNTMALNISSLGEVESCIDFRTKFIENYNNLNIKQHVQAYDEAYELCNTNKEFIIQYSNYLSFNSEIDKAKRILNTFKDANPQHENDKEVLLAEISVVFLNASIQNENGIGNISESTMSDFRRVEKDLIDMTDRFPDWHMPYRILGSLNLILGDYGSTIRYAKKANGIEKTLPAYKYILLASFKLEKYKDVIDTMEVMFSFLPRILEDKDIVLATTRAYLHLNELALAKNLLLYFQMKRPEFKNDPEIIHLFETINKSIIN